MAAAKLTLFLRPLSKDIGTRRERKQGGMKWVKILIMYLYWVTSSYL